MAAGLSAIPDNTRDRVLYEGEVVEVTNETFVARFDEAIPAVIGANVFAHAEVNQKFMQQAATVQAVLQTEPPQVLAFARTGEPISAESRNSYRVSLAASAIPMTINQDDKCQLLDVSPPVSRSSPNQSSSPATSPKSP